MGLNPKRSKNFCVKSNCESASRHIKINHDRQETDEIKTNFVSARFFFSLQQLSTPITLSIRCHQREV